jgi:hypothetical protein
VENKITGWVFMSVLVVVILVDLQIDPGSILVHNCVHLFVLEISPIKIRPGWLHLMM